MNQIDHFFLLDTRRSKLLKKSNIKKFIETYSAVEKYNDKNTPDFWSDKIIQKSKPDFMRIDRIKTVSTMISDIKPDRLLNIGVGKGELEENLKKSKITLYGMDITYKGIQSANRNKMFTSIVGMLPNLPFKSETFDAVSVLEVLEHIPHFKIFEVLKQIKRVLKKQSYLFVSVPINENYSSKHNPNGHLRRYTPEIIIKELEIAGFEVIESKYLFAFSQYYYLKKFLIQFFPNYRKPNVLILKLKLKP